MRRYAPPVTCRCRQQDGACHAFALHRSRFPHFAAIEHLTDPAPDPDLIALARSYLAAVERAMQRMPYRHRSVLLALRIDERTRQEVADEYQVSLTSVDTMLRQALDHCARETGQNAIGGISQSRRGFSRRWQCLPSKPLAALASVT
ncbi:RNA polymerase sigma factor [Janthinobacterium svalbardensis]|uniref:RNA polymerase sigma factor n=1 Tax=Janthinobacterium svalbardensis TaxID=368607 RepID=UPI002FCD6FCC